MLSACATVYWAGSAALGAMAVTAPPRRGRNVRLLLPNCHMTCTTTDTPSLVHDRARQNSA